MQPSNNVAVNGIPAGPTMDLLERHDLLERIGHLLDALVRGESRVVVIEGGLGAGKSALLHEIGDRAKARVATLVARCAAATGKAAKVSATPIAVTIWLLALTLAVVSKYGNALFG